MKFDNKSLKGINWTARIIAVFSLIVGVPLYFAYGNPAPFVDPNYDFFNNLWRIIFPLMFVGLGLGWKYEKIGGWLIIIGIMTRFISSLIILDGLSFHTFIPLVAGILFLIVGYSKKSN